MPAWRVIRVREATRLDDRLQPVPVKVVEYVVGEQGPFEYRTDAARFTAQAVQQALDEQAAHILALMPPSPP